MAHCLVNDIPEILDFRPETWGQLLGGLDRRLSVQRRVVTAVRFDGVDQPSYRHDGLAGLALGEVAQVEVDAEDAVALLRAAVDAAEDSLPQLVSGVRTTAAALRRGAATAATELGALVTALQSLVALTVAAGTAADLAFGPDAGAERAVRVACGRIEDALASVLRHQGAGDRAALADGLDHHLAPAVAGWTAVLTPIRQRAEV